MRDVVIVRVVVQCGVVGGCYGNRSVTGLAGSFGISVRSIVLVQHEIPEGDAFSAAFQQAEEDVPHVIDQTRTEVVVPCAYGGFGEIQFLVRRACDYLVQF